MERRIVESLQVPERGQEVGERCSNAEWKRPQMTSFLPSGSQLSKSPYIDGNISAPENRSKKTGSFHRQ
jgi:hypothetical protein